ncbi:hypothetical protein ACFX2I_037906 [Malus domestica]
MILFNEETDGVSTSADVHVLPATDVSAAPAATILFRGTAVRDSSTLAVASLSSRVPKLANPGIQKPDFIGPGVSILAAWPFSVDNTTNSKSSHPCWSPAAIKSAIMISTYLLNLEGKPILDETFKPADVLATSAGHVNPSKANDPGLVYDIQPDDYIPYLCGLGNKDDEVSLRTDKYRAQRYRAYLKES